MRIDLKPAAFLAAAAFGLLIIFGAAWPGPGVWLLALGLILVAAAAAIWLRRAQTLAAGQQAGSPAFSPSADAMIYSRSATGLPRNSRTQPRTSPGGISIEALVASVGVVALMLYIGGVLVSNGNTGQEQVGPSAAVDVIDRTETDAVGNAAGVGTATAQGLTSSTTTQPTTADEAASTSPAAPLRPIVVNDPSGAAPVSQRPGLVVQSETSVESAADQAQSDLADTETITYIVEQGDTLWDIANRFDVPVAVLADLNTLFNAEIHPGDELVVPLPEE